MRTEATVLARASTLTLSLGCAGVKRTIEGCFSFCDANVRDNNVVISFLINHGARRYGHGGGICSTARSFLLIRIFVYVRIQEFYILNRRKLRLHLSEG